MASSRVATVPMFVRAARPHPPDDLTQLRAIRHENKSIARPSAGRALSVGPAMVTSVPPGPVRLRIASRCRRRRHRTPDRRRRRRPACRGLGRQTPERRSRRALHGRPPAARHDPSAGLAGELCHHRPHCAAAPCARKRPPRLEGGRARNSPATRQARHRQLAAHREVDVARQRRKVVRLDRQTPSRPACRRDTSPRGRYARVPPTAPSCRSRER